MLHYLMIQRSRLGLREPFVGSFWWMVGEDAWFMEWLKGARRIWK